MLASFHYSIKAALMVKQPSTGTACFPCLRAIHDINLNRLTKMRPSAVYRCTALQELQHKVTYMPCP